MGPVLPRCLEGAMVVSPLPILIFLVAFCIGYYKNRNEEAVDNTIIVERVVQESVQIEEEEVGEVELKEFPDS